MVLLLLRLLGVALSGHQDRHGALLAAVQQDGRRKFTRALLPRRPELGVVAATSAASRAAALVPAVKRWRILCAKAPTAHTTP